MSSGAAKLQGCSVTTKCALKGGYGGLFFKFWTLGLGGNGGTREIWP